MAKLHMDDNFHGSIDLDRIEAIISDGVGNWFSLTRRTDGAPAKHQGS